jgi:fumarate reductase flavoprotein subunit
VNQTSTTSIEPDCDVLIIGAGAAGLIAALRATAAGATVIVVERDRVPRGSTALSAGLIPATGTRAQKAAGIVDSAAQLARDIMAKADGEPDPVAVDAVTRAVGIALDWLSETYDLPFSVITNFNYPGHSAFRMHGLPSRSGVELMDRLRATAEHAGVTILAEATATALHTSDSIRVVAVDIQRPDGTSETLKCRALILACNGYGGNPSLVAHHIPELAAALYFGHAGNAGDALLWGEKLGAMTRHLSGHQGHGSVAHPHGSLITWATMTEGGFQLNQAGERFSNEAYGYSEQAAVVLRQPGGVVWSIFDERIANVARQFEDFKNAEANGALIKADSTAALATALRIAHAPLAATFAGVAGHKTAATQDEFGRDWRGLSQLEAPYYAVQVTGALFHTQGGLVVDPVGRVKLINGLTMLNLYAVGGAACGVSGSKASGYLSGNGLLTAVAYGYLAGEAAARTASHGVTIAPPTTTTPTTANRE